MDTTPCMIEDKTLCKDTQHIANLHIQDLKAGLPSVSKEQKQNINTQNLSNLKLQSYELLFRILCTHMGPLPLNQGD